MEYKDKMDYPNAEYEIMVNISSDNFTSIKVALKPINFEGLLFLEEIELLKKMEENK